MKSSSILRSIVAAVTMSLGLSTSSAFADCPGDSNGDNIVDATDLGFLLNNWNSVSGGADLAALLAAWGPCDLGAAQGITLVIDPRNLNLNLTEGCSAWVVGFANVKGGGTTQRPFKALQPSASPLYAASFEDWTFSTALPMIQIYGGSVTGTTTIWTGTSELDGGQLQIFVSPIGTEPDGPKAQQGTGPTDVSVTQIPPAPYATAQTYVPYDIVEFTYIPISKSTFDVSGVNCFVVPMTMTPLQLPLLGSVGINTNISRDRIGTAYTQFMTHDLQGGAEYQRLLYDSSVLQPKGSCYATAPSAPDTQFFAIVNPWFWINQNNTCSSTTTSFWNNYWNVVLDGFFVDGNKLKINVNGPKEYTGTCALDPDSNVLTYTFVDESTSTTVLNTACTTSGTVLKLPRPSSTPIPPSSVSQAAALLFGNTADIFCEGTCCKMPAGPGGQIIDAILEAFGRGVALDGLNPQPIQIASATSTSFEGPTAIASPRGIAKITTNGTHGMPLGRQSASCKVNIVGVGVSDYNGIKPTANNPAYGIYVSSDSEFTFAYDTGNVVMDSVSAQKTGDPMVTLHEAPSSPITQGEVVYLTNATPDNNAGQYTVTEVINLTQFKINANVNGTTSGGNVWRLWSQAGSGGTVTPVGASSVAWNNFNNWYGAPGNPTHTPQAYNTYSKFLHYSTIEGTDSRITSPRGTPIFIDNKAYGFGLDETPVGPYSGETVSPKFELEINDGSTINLTLSPWVQGTPGRK